MSLICRFLGYESSSATAVEALPTTWLVGTPGEIVGKLAELNSFRPTKIMLWPPLHHDLDMIGLIGREVLPACDEF